MIISQFLEKNKSDCIIIGSLINKIKIKTYKYFDDYLNIYDLIKFEKF